MTTIRYADIKTIKEEVVDYLRTKIAPRNTFATSEFTLSTNTVVKEVAQSFKPFSSMLGTLSSYVSTVSVVMKKYGTPSDGLSLYIETDSSSLPSGTSISTGTISTSDVGVTSTTISVPMTISTKLGSNTKYWLTILPNASASTVNYFTVYYDTVDTHYDIGSMYWKNSGDNWNPYSKDLYFTIKEPNWIYPDYPRNDLNRWSFPRIAVDVISRPRILREYITPSVTEQVLMLEISFYTVYPDELDTLFGQVDKALSENRTGFTNFRLLTPSFFTQAVPYREFLFARVADYEIIITQSNL